MRPAKIKKVRAFLRKQHNELIAVKTTHIRRAITKSKPAKKSLAKKVGEWTNDNGKFDMLKGKDAKQWAAKTAIALSVTVRNAIADSSEDAAQLAVDHLQDLSAFATDEFDAEPLDVDETAADYDDEGRLDDLQSKYVGGPRFGAYATLMKIATAVMLGTAVSDFADSIGADSSDSDDVADGLFGSIDSRTETYVRTETGRAYGDALHDAADSNDMQKRWATIDPGCDRICHPVDGQTVDMDDLFELGVDGEEGAIDYPPAHPNCDCTWLPWKEDWGNTQSTDDIEEAA